MAMAATINPRFPRGLMIGNMLALFGTIAATGSYATNGDTLDLGPVALGTGLSNKQPIFVFIFGVSGFDYEYDLANKKCRVRTGSAAQSALTELNAGAYPAGITADVIGFFAVVPKM